MGPARRSVPAALRFLGGLSVPLLLLLLLCPPAAQGDCSLPPEVPNAHPTLSDRDLKSFPEGTTVTYKCNEGFVKVPGKPDSVICLSNNQWSEVAAFCNRSCDVPPRLRFASLKRSFSKQNYFPEGFVVEYDCRPGYRRNQTLSEKLTCLQNFTWSTPDEFCKKKSCPTPGDIAHGHVSITTDISYGASISFSCDTGYRLVGATSSYCSLVDQGVEWSDPLPKCEEIVCPEPQEISNGSIQNPRKTYVYQQSVKYQCNQGFTLIGENSIYCTVKDDQGEWSGLPPECKENAQISKGMPAVQKPSMASVPSTKVPSAPQKTTTVNVPAKQSSAVVPRATTHFRSTSSHKGRGTLSSDANIAAIALITYMKTEKHAVVFRNFTVIGDTSEVKPLVSSKRTHMYNIDSFAYDASNRRLADLAEEEIRRKYTQVCRIFLVS
ncbi:complement decay-accelerating factor isoform X4 [Panthera uncia]|uniref:complement decay-accelerating factor isoform X4 n=1 Tax=Panthera uncia TaxID=29064 RepID=UPI0020FFA44A|nr:complement decay-accelerating factor isoform X4 [Panthera uncia]XP_060499960.1 complement decay-accelerating factor isoform X9 [Panthera onca]